MKILELLVSRDSWLFVSSLLSPTLLLTTFNVVQAGPGGQQYDTGALLNLTQYRQQHRRTLDGRLCAAAFVEQSQTFTDCTGTKAPDGTSGSDWCYVEAQLLGKGSRDWDYCRPVIDYDFIRQISAQALKAKLADSERLLGKLASEKNRLDDVLTRFDKICKHEVENTQKSINEIEAVLEHADHSLRTAEQARSSLTTLEASVDEMDQKFQEEVQRALRKPENCRGLRGYEDDGDPDGISGAYYPNPYFSQLGGKREVRVDPQIDFVWTSRSPAPNIPHEAFSVRWDGFLKAPETGEYELLLETTCGGRVFVNKQLVLTDRMADSAYEEYGAEEAGIPLQPFSGISGLRSQMSKPMILDGGNKVPIRVEVIHSTHLLLADEATAIVKLSWKGPHFSETEIIPPSAFYSTNQRPFLKLSGMPAAWVDVAFLYPGIQPFLDLRNLFVGDLSPELENSKLVRMKAELQRAPNLLPGQVFEFEINTPAVLVIAHNKAQAIPWENSGQRTISFAQDEHLHISFYEALNVNSRASQVIPLAIERAILPSAGTYRFLMKPSAPYLVFLQALAADNDICAGELKVVSDRNGKYFDRCVASSSESPEYGCEYAFNMRRRDVPFGIWRSDRTSKGVGQFVELFFTKKVRLTKFHLKPRDDPVTWPSEVQLSFSPQDHSQDQRFTLLFSSNLDFLEYPMAPIVTKYVRVEVTQSYEAGQPTGASIEFIGSECQDLELPPGQMGKAEEAVSQFEIEDCGTTISAISDFPSLRPGLSLAIRCPSTCQTDSSSQGPQHPAVQEPVSTGFVYGTNIYAPDSAICYSAVHSGLCLLIPSSPASRSGLCALTMRILDGQMFYAGSLRHGVKSESHGPEEYSFVLEPANEWNISPILGSGQPVPVREQIILFHAFDGESPELPENTYVDDGSIFGVKQGSNPGNNLKFGWMRQAETTSCKASDQSVTNPLLGANDPLMQWMSNGGGVEFPPSPTSALCTEGKDCSPNNWSIELFPQAFVTTTVQLGRPCDQSEGEHLYFLQINGEDVLNKKKLAPSEYHYVTLSHRKLGADGKLTLSAVCSSDASGNVNECESGLTTIMAVKVTIG